MIIKEIVCQYKSRRKFDCKVGNPLEVAEFFRKVLNEDRESMVVLHLNAKLIPLSWEKVAVGTLDNLVTHPREIFKGAIMQNSSMIIVAHNHPSGNSMPSPEDFDLMKKILDAGELLMISLLDFMVIGGDNIWSAANEGFLSPTVELKKESSENSEKKV